MSVYLLLTHQANTKPSLTQKKLYYNHPGLMKLTKEFCYNPLTGVARNHDFKFGPLFPLNYNALLCACVWPSFLC
jgi:hypothetical protein